MTKHFLSYCAVLILMVSCVTKKQYSATVAELSTTQKKLDSTKLQVNALKNELNIVKITQEQKQKEAAQNEITREYKIYKQAIAAFDYGLASAQLSRLVEIDSTNRKIYYDSLALYHYFYLMTPGIPRSNNSALFYTQKGLQLNPQNVFLLEILGKLKMESGNDTGAFAIFNSLYEKTGDYTYLYQMVVSKATISQNIKYADSVINLVLKRPDSEFKEVRIEFAELKSISKLSAKAVFLYLRAQMQVQVQNNRTQAIKTLKQVLAIAPDFLPAKLFLQQLTNPQPQQPYGY